MSASKLGNKCFLMLAATMALFAALGAGCGKLGNNEAVPKPMSKLEPQDADESVQSRQSRWEKLAIGLGVHNNQVAEGLAEKLAEPSNLLTERQAELKSYLDRLGAGWLEQFSQYNCSEISTFVATEGIDLEVSRVFRLSVKLASGIEAQSLVFVPITPSAESNPLLLYAHSSAKEINATEVAAVFSDLLSSHVVIAPSFDGLDIWSSEAAQALAVHQCVLQAVAGKQTNEASVNLRTSLLQSNLQFIGGGSPVAQLPASVVVGLDRGGLIAWQLAARSAIQLKFLSSQAPEGSKAAVGLPQAFSCAAAINSQHSLSMGESRLALEMAVKEQLAFSNFARVPTLALLNRLVLPYVQTGSDADLDALLMSVIERDATLFSPLLLGAVRNWRTMSAGALLVAHAEDNKVVPMSQAQIIAGVLSKQAATPGIEQVLGTAPASVKPVFLSSGTESGASSLMHADAAFFGLLKDSAALKVWRESECQNAL